MPRDTLINILVNVAILLGNLYDMHIGKSIRQLISVGILVYISIIIH